jgi:hypothetical protein
MATIDAAMLTLRSEVQLPTVALLDAHVSLIDTLQHRNLLFRGLPYWTGH